MSIPLSQTSSLVLVCDKNKSYQSQKSKEFLSHLDLSAGQKMYEKIQHLHPYLDEVIPNRKFLIHNYIRDVLNSQGQDTQVLTLACGWDPILVKINEEFPKNSFFGVDNESTKLQEALVQKILPHSSISYLSADITDSKILVEKLREKGWKSNQPTLIVIEGISYYIHPNIFWKSLQLLKEHIQAPCFICGDFLVDWTQQEQSKITQRLAVDIFDMIKETCSQEYYAYPTEQIRKHLEEIGFPKIKFFTQDQIQKQRLGSSEPWSQGEGHIQLFTG